MFPTRYRNIRHCLTKIKAQSCTTPLAHRSGKIPLMRLGLYITYRPNLPLKTTNACTVSHLYYSTFSDNNVRVRRCEIVHVAYVSYCIILWTSLPKSISTNHLSEPGAISSDSSYLTYKPQCIRDLFPLRYLILGPVTSRRFSRRRFE
jgi:hypothetical protein